MGSTRFQLQDLGIRNARTSADRGKAMHGNKNFISVYINRKCTNEFIDRTICLANDRGIQPELLTLVEFFLEDGVTRR